MIPLPANVLRFTCGGRAAYPPNCPNVTAAADKCNRLLGVIAAMATCRKPRMSGRLRPEPRDTQGL
jgi:hypothetical protein